jgi:3-hydroxyacyl-[acyl-carrier-protein] dehydratase
MPVWQIPFHDAATFRSVHQFPQTTCFSDPMRFVLIDRIVELEPNVKITALKTLTMAEEYLADHFPNFPVMPGVLMVEAMTQAGAWLVRASDNFRHSIVILKEAVNVKYGQFFEPAQTMTIIAEVIKRGEQETKIKASGAVDGRIIVSARLTLKHFNLADANPLHRDTDEQIIREMKTNFRLLDYSAQKSPAEAMPLTN